MSKSITRKKIDTKQLQSDLVLAGANVGGTIGGYLLGKAVDTYMATPTTNPPVVIPPAGTQGLFGRIRSQIAGLDGMQQGYKIVKSVGLVAIGLIGHQYAAKESVKMLMLGVTNAGLIHAANDIGEKMFGKKIVSANLQGLGKHKPYLPPLTNNAQRILSQNAPQASQQSPVDVYATEPSHDYSGYNASFDGLSMAMM